MSKEHGKIKVMKEEDRNLIVPILVKEGYTVRLLRCKEHEKSRAYTYYLEFEKE